MNRSQTRELAFKLLYQIEIQKEINDEDMQLFFENNNITSEEAKEYIKDAIFGINEHIEEIQELIEKNLKADWKIDRISKIDLSLLKLAIYEIKYKNIPYKVVGSFYFYNRKEIKDLISYMKLIYNQHDDVSLLRIINSPKRGIGAKTIENLTEKANEQGKSIFEVINSGKELAFKHMIEDLIIREQNLSLTELVEEILIKSGMKQELVNEKSMEADIRLENLEEFKTITKSFEENNGIVSLEEFLMEISLVSDVEEHKNNNHVVTLMTVHSAKGLEFDYVFLIGMEEGIFPHNNSFMNPEDLEEERRLCYVAITRAKKSLWLVNARRRTIYGMESQNPPSRFIDEIDASYLDKDVEEKKELFRFFPKKETLVDKNAEYQIGDHIIHNQFGEGVVVGVDKSILTIAFPHPYGIKKLLKGHKSIQKKGV